MKFLFFNAKAIIYFTAFSISILASGSIVSKTIPSSGPCYRPNMAYKATCTSQVLNIINSTTCEEIINNLGQGHLYSLNTVNRIQEEDIAIECPSGNLFCCAQIAIDTNPCVDQPNVMSGNKYKIDGVGSIHCREEN